MVEEPHDGSRCLLLMEMCAQHLNLSDTMWDNATEVLTIRKLTYTLVPRVFTQVIHRAWILGNGASAPAVFKLIQHSPKPMFKKQAFSVNPIININHLA